MRRARSMLSVESGFKTRGNARIGTEGHEIVIMRSWSETSTHRQTGWELLLRHLLSIHSSCEQCSNGTLARALRGKGDKEPILRLVQDFVRPSCQENQNQRPHSFRSGPRVHVVLTEGIPAAGPGGATPCELPQQRNDRDPSSDLPALQREGAACPAVVTLSGSKEGQALTTEKPSRLSLGPDHGMRTWLRNEGSCGNVKMWRRVGGAAGGRGVVCL